MVEKVERSCNLSIVSFVSPVLFANMSIANE